MTTDTYSAFSQSITLGHSWSERVDSYLSGTFCHP